MNVSFHLYTVSTGRTALMALVLWIFLRGRRDLALGKC